MNSIPAALILALALLSICLPERLPSADDNPEAQAHLDRALQLHKEKKFSAAAKALNQAIAAGMRNHDAFILAGDCMMRVHDYRAAHSAFDAALGFDDQSVLALRGRATAALKIGHTESALDATARLYRLGEKDYMLRGKAFAQNKQLYLAIAEYQKILTRLPSGHRSIIDAYFERGEALSGMERREEAIKAFTRSLELHEHKDVLLLRGREYGRLKDYAKAIADFERALEIAPGDPETQENASGNIAYMKRLAAKPPRPSSGKKKPDPIQGEMDALAFDKDPAAAKARLDAARQEHSNSPSMLHALYRYHASREDWDEAFFAIGTASKNDPENLDFLRKFAATATRLGKVGYALQAHTRSIRFGDQAAHAGRARQLLALSLGGVALSDIEAALKLEPDNPEYHYWRSVSLLEQPAKLAVRADAAFDKALGLGFMGERILRAQVLDTLGRHAEAISDYTHDIESGADSAGVYLRRGWSHEKLGKLELAAGDFAAAIERAEAASSVAQAARESLASVRSRLGRSK